MLGGRERATVAVAEQLAARGYETAIINPHPEAGEKNGVDYLPLSALEDDRTIHGALIAVNGYDSLPALPYRLRLIWAQTGLPHIAPLLSYVDAVVVNSQAKIDYLNGPNHGLIRPPKVHIIPNGVELAPWDAVTIPRVPGRLLYSQSPDRGLVHLLRWWPALKARLPDLSLHVTYSIDRIYDFQWMHELRAEMCRYIDRGRDLPDVTYLGVVSADDYRRELKEAELYVFPCDPGVSGETFSIGVMEACAAYTPVLGSGDVSIAEIYSDVVHIEDGPIFDGHWIERITRLMTDPTERQRLVPQARALAERHQWRLIADRWETLLKQLAEGKVAA